MLNKVLRNEEDFQALPELEIDGPVTMVHLSRFKDRAEHSDGREADLTGAEAYALYRGEMVNRVSSAGGRLVYLGSARHLVLGVAEELWDEVLIVEFPTKETFVDIVSDPETAKWGEHRRAGLADQLLIATTARTRPASVASSAASTDFCDERTRTGCCRQ